MAPKNTIKMVVFDLDGTLTKEPNSWGLIHSILGVSNKAKKNAELFFSNKIDYKEWAKLDILLWKKCGLDYFQLKKIVEDYIEAIDGAEETIQELKKHNIKTIVISSGLSIICEHFKKLLNYDKYFANKLIFDKNNKLKDIEINVGFNKDKILLNYLRNNGISIEYVVSVGDNINDIQLFELTPKSIAINPKHDSLKYKATHVIHTSNLTDILKFIL